MEHEPSSPAFFRQYDLLVLFPNSSHEIAMSFGSWLYIMEHLCIFSVVSVVNLFLRTFIKP